MVRIAPRYDERILEAVRSLDDRAEPMAEICRRVASAAERLGLTRPSYVHVRRLLRAERERQDDERERRKELEKIVGDVVEGLLVGRGVDAYEVADRVREVSERRSHD